MASPNTIKRNEELKNLKPKMIEAVDKSGRPLAFRNGEYNSTKHTRRILKGLHKGNTYGKKNYAKRYTSPN